MAVEASDMSEYKTPFKKARSIFSRLRQTKAQKKMQRAQDKVIGDWVEGTPAGKARGALGTQKAFDAFERPLRSMRVPPK